MNNNAVVTSPFKSDTEFFSGVSEMLSAISHANRPANTRTRAILDNFANSLFDLNEKGFSCSEISLFLGQCKIDVSADSIKEYLIQEQAKELVYLKQLITSNHKAEWNEVINRSAIIERGLRQSLKEGTGLFLNYQPQIDMFTGQIIGAEALVRWKFGGNVIHPSEFISIAEKSDLIVLIGEWVLHQACIEAKNWQSIGLGGDPGIKMGVNLSVQQFSNSLPDLVHNLLCDTGLSPNLLGLEITESVLASHESLSILHSLHDSGIRLSIDDFGTGYSCLSQLKDMPLDTIKIDRAFVKDLGREKSAAVMIEAIVNLARKFNMETVAEGVENETQVTMLKSLGCSVCQGFLYSMPLSGEDFIRFADRGLSS